MTSELQGSLEGEGLRIGIVVARFNESITSRLLQGAKSALVEHGACAEDVTVVWVPGSFEIPLIAKKMAQSGRYDAVVGLGAVIKGETDHYEYVAGEAVRGIASAGLEAGVPVIFGVLTTDTVEQAMERSGGQSGKYAEAGRVPRKPTPDDKSGDGTHGNSGYNAGVAAIEMANLVRDLDSR